MAATVTWEGLRDLATFRAELGWAISFFLDLDPSQILGGDVQAGGYLPQLGQAVLREGDRDRSNGRTSCRKATTACRETSTNVRAQGKRPQRKAWNLGFPEEGAEHLKVLEAPG